MHPTLDSDLLIMPDPIYSINYDLVDVVVMFGFGVAGYLMKKFEYDLAPLVLAYVLGPLFEDALQQSLNLSGGNFAIFFTRPIAAVGLILALLIIISSIVPWVARTRSMIRVEEGIE